MGEAHSISIKVWEQIAFLGLSVFTTLCRSHVYKNVWNWAMNPCGYQDCSLLVVRLVQR